MIWSRSHKLFIVSEENCASPPEKEEREREGHLLTPLNLFRRFGARAERVEADIDRLERVVFAFQALQELDRVARAPDAVLRHVAVHPDREPELGLDDAQLVRDWGREVRVFRSRRRTGPRGTTQSGVWEFERLVEADLADKARRVLDEVSFERLEERVDRDGLGERLEHGRERRVRTSLPVVVIVVRRRRRGEQARVVFLFRWESVSRCERDWMREPRVQACEEISRAQLRERERASVCQSWRELAPKQGMTRAGFERCTTLVSRWFDKELLMTH